MWAEKTPSNEQQTLLEQRRALDEAAIVSETDIHGNITFVNDKFVAISGYTRSELLGQNHRIINSHQHDPAFFSALWQTISQGDTWHGDICNKAKDGHLYWVSTTIVPILDPITTRPVRYQSIRFEITDYKQLEAKLKYQAYHDPLTGLFNRRALIEQFNLVTNWAEQQHRPIAVCLLDIDNFKPINDELGHALGDQLLKEISNRLIQSVNRHDIIARLGGDEFILLLTTINELSSLNIAIEQLITAMNQPFLIGNAQFNISASIGVSCYPEHSQDADMLIRYADQAMYQAKRKAGAQNYVLFSDTLEQQKIERHLLKEISLALKSNAFQLYYQPKVNMHTGEVIGMEALLRWIHPTRGVILPLDFLPKIEATKLIIDIGEWVIASALQQLALWQAEGKKWVVSINISPYHFQQEDFLAKLQNILKRFPLIQPNTLEIEILETIAIGDIARTKQHIAACQKLGIRFALDDFGTGYTSLNYLKQLHTDTIKIDKSFIRDILEDPSDVAIVQAVVGIGNAFKQNVIAEGVESIEHGILLLRLGCHLAQGYAISWPIPASQIIDWDRKFIADPIWHSNWVKAN